MTDSELLEQFQMIFQGMSQMEERLTQRIKDEIHESEQRTHAYIENTVGKRIDTLFDGYKLTHEKQWELERETEKLKEQVNELQTRLAVIEKKISA